MGSHILDILRQGIWASLTGGWFYDPHLSIFINTFHLYLWMFFLALPLILHLTVAPTLMIWGIYCAVVGLVFILLKVFNYRLHHMFDTCEVIEEVDEKSKKESSNPAVDGNEDQTESIEMVYMANRDLSSGDTKHLDAQADAQSEHSKKHSNESSVRRRPRRDGKRGSKRETLSVGSNRSNRAPLAEMDKDDMDLSMHGAAGCSGSRRHHHHSNSEDEDDELESDPDDDASMPTTITTRADVEAEPSDCQVSLPDDSLHSPPLTSPSESKHSCDADLSDVSPEHVSVKVKKSRRKAQRAKSALESSETLSKHTCEKGLHSRPSLPPRPKLNSVINKDTGVSIIRPWSDQTINHTKQMLESDEIFVIGYEVMNRNSPTTKSGTHTIPEATDEGSCKNSPSKQRRSKRLVSSNCNPEFVHGSVRPRMEHNRSHSDHIRSHPLEHNTRSQSDRVRSSSAEHNGRSSRGEQCNHNRSQSDQCREASLNTHTVKNKIQEEPVSNTGNSEQSSKTDCVRCTKRTQKDESGKSCNKDVLDDVLMTSGSCSKPYKRNAVSEERSVDNRNNNILETSKTSSQPSVKVSSSFLTSSSSDSDISLGEVFAKPDKTQKSHRSKQQHTRNDNNTDGKKSRNGGGKAAANKDKPDKSKVKTRTKHSKCDNTTNNTKKPRPNSAELIKSNSFHNGSNVMCKSKVKIHSSPTLSTNPGQCSSNGGVDKPKDIGFARVSKMLARAASERLSNDRVPSVPSVNNSQQSMLGLDWLFVSDSDSTDTQSHHDHDIDSMTSTSFDSSFDNSANNPHLDYSLPHDSLDGVSSHSSTCELDPDLPGNQLSDGEIDVCDMLPSKLETLKKTKRRGSVGENLEIQSGFVHHGPEDFDVADGVAATLHGRPDDELANMRKQGAIPKHFNKPLPPLPEPSSREDAPDTKASSPASFDLSDPEEFHRKLIEILNEPAETSTEQLKRVMAVMETKKTKSSSVRSKCDKEDKSVSAGEAGLFLTGPDNNDDAENKSSNDSKPVTPTEISSLLPDNDMNEEPRGVSRLARKPVRKRRHATSSHTRSPTIPPALRTNNHIAESHEDTTEGATHLFQDEDGNWYSYTFGDTAATAMSLEAANNPRKAISEDRWSSSSCASGSMVVLDNLKDGTKDFTLLDSNSDMRLPGSVDIQAPRGILQAYVDQLLQNGRRLDSSDDSDSRVGSSQDVTHTKHFYKFKLFPKKFIKVYFDRLALLALLDRNLSVIENIIAVMMAMLVGALGALVLARGFYVDFWMFLFCFIMAGCQYSLVKSVQPDAASPMHGYNHLIVFSRPFYFCICCGLMLLLDWVSQMATGDTVYVYGMPFTTSTILWFARDFLKVFLLCLPLIFTVGLLPQVNTFCMFVLEQIDTHVFGGNATVSLISAVYCFIRSVFTAGFLYVICFLTLIQLGQNIVDDPDPCKNPEFAQTAAFSIFCALLVALSYHLSRSASDPSVLWMLIRDKVLGEKKRDTKKDTGTNEESTELEDPLPGKMKNCVSERLQSDLLISIVIMILSFAIHVSTVFIQPLIDEILYFTVAGFGFLIHYVIPQLRKEMPWLCCSHPILQSKERNMFEANGPAKIMWFEKLYIWLRFIERNGFYPIVVICALTRSVPAVICKFGILFGPLILTVCSLKLLRFTFSNTPKQHMILAFTVLFFKYDFRLASETTLIDYFFIAILFSKFCDLYLKMKFIVTYIAPWQITWGSAFHAFAQPFSVPHSAMLFLQAGVSAFFSTPLNPFLGSAIFITSYVRPVKFWEKDYNTKRVDHSNTRLSQQLERNTGADDNNLNSIFYEHLTRSLQHSLCGDLMIGRWGNSEQGDTFIMASDSLNALVHIIEMGNGLVTFQLRGLEFRGTYCQQREVEAITEGVEENEGFCCFEPGHLPHFLSLNSAFNQRWLSWEVVVTKYVLEGYSISDNNAASMVGLFDFRKVFINYYVQSIIYYTVRSPRLEQWLDNSSIMETLALLNDEDYCDADVTFSVHVDDDYDAQNSGISRKSFCNRNLDWIQYCASRRDKAVDCRRDSPLVSLCFALSLLGRRALGTASHNNASASVEFFLYGLHALFKGDFRITSSRDEWVFADMELLRRVVAPGVRMSLKLHQDHFQSSDAYESEEALYDAISDYETNLVISHEADPAWRNAVLSNTPSLLALRNVFDEGSDEYKIIMLNKRYLTFRIVKVNRECVRGLWAGQQQELIFLRNRNPERGSIQNAKQALRNMINSSCDQPIGYPIYVSPLTTSYSSTNEQYTSVIGGEFIIANVKAFFKNAWQSLRRHCGASCTSGSSAFVEGDIPYSCTHQAAAAVLGQTGRICPPPTTPVNSAGDTTLGSRGNRGSLISTTSSATSKPRSMVTLAGFIGENQLAIKDKDTFATNIKVKITDVHMVYDTMNLMRRIDVQWPNEEWRNNGGRNAWAGWTPIQHMEGTVVHRWSPCHRDIMKRSHVDKTILLMQIGEKYVPIAEQGVTQIYPNTDG